MRKCWLNTKKMILKTDASLSCKKPQNYKKSPSWLIANQLNSREHDNIVNIKKEKNHKNCNNKNYLKKIKFHWIFMLTSQANRVRLHFQVADNSTRFRAIVRLVHWFFVESFELWFNSIKLFDNPPDPNGDRIHKESLIKRS